MSLYEAHGEQVQVVGSTAYTAAKTATLVSTLSAVTATQGVT